MPPKRATAPAQLQEAVRPARVDQQWYVWTSSALRQWRVEHPVRAPASGGTLRRTGAKKPTKPEQKPWHVYTNYRDNGGVQQEWFMTPFLVQMHGEGIQPLEGDEATRPMRVQSQGASTTQTSTASSGWQMLTHLLVQ